MFRQLICGEIPHLDYQDQEQAIFPYFTSIVIIFYYLLHRRSQICQKRTITTKKPGKSFFYAKAYFYLPFIIKIRNQDNNFCKKNISSLFAYFHKVTHEFVVNLKLLEQYREDKLRFITKFQFSPNEQDQTYINILQSPIAVQNNTSIFLLIINWAYSSANTNHLSKQPHIATNMTKISQKVKNHSYFQSEQNVSSKTQIDSCKKQMALFVYAISDTIFIQRNHSEVIINIITQNDAFSYKQNNKLIVFNKVTFDKNSQYRVSTAADTKGYDLRRASFQSEKNSSDQSDFRLSKILSPKNTSQSKFPLSSLVTPQNVRRKQRTNDKLSKYFRNVLNLECEQEIQLEKILGIIENASERNIQSCSYILYDTIQKWFCQKSPINWEAQQFYKMNQSNILSWKIQKLLSEYRLLLEMEFKNITTKSIEQIKSSLSRLSNHIIENFFRDTQNCINQNSQAKYYQHLLSQINREQSVFLRGLGCVKQELVNRKVSVIQDPNYAIKTNRSSLLFQNLVGEDQINSLQIGYQVYKQTLTQKMTEIFDQLLRQKPKYSKQKLAITTQKDFIFNLQRRINIYQQKKKILQQTLFLDKKEEQNLQEYLKGVERKQIENNQVISEKDQSQIN